MTFEEYAHRRVVVTGCSSGIGRATARALVALGAEVIGIDLKLPDTELASFEATDLAEPASIERSIETIGGHVDALFNCAAVAPMLAAAQVMKVNFLGTRLLTDRIVELMSAGGAIVSTSSNGGYGWRKHLPLLLEFVATHGFDEGAAWYAEHEDATGYAYSFGKEALNVWTMQQSAVLIQRGIRINTVSPGAVQTPMLAAIEAALSTQAIQPTEHPIGRRSSPEEQAAPLLFLNSDAASYINGADLPVDGGYWAAQSITGKLWS